MAQVVIGREAEKDLLQKIFHSEEPELVAIYGRRRIGKTFLIRNVFEEQLAFEFSGIHNAQLGQQLENFSQALSTASKSLPLATPSGWLQAFNMLMTYLTPIVEKKKDSNIF